MKIIAIKEECPFTGQVSRTMVGPYVPIKADPAGAHLLKRRGWWTLPTARWAYEGDAGQR